MYYACVYDISRLLTIFIMKYHKGDEIVRKTGEDLACCWSKFQHKDFYCCFYQSLVVRYDVEIKFQHLRPRYQRNRRWFPGIQTFPGVMDSGIIIISINCVFRQIGWKNRTETNILFP
jgi:hypothetical protein